MSLKFNGIMNIFLFRKAIISHISKNTDRSLVFMLFLGDFLDKKSWGYWGTDHPVHQEQLFNLLTTLDIVIRFWLEE